MNRPKPPAKSQQSNLRSQFRIIGGHWRSRRFSFPATPGLRPTPDRVRETLFNWLTDSLRNAHCLDLFAGSGALGLEALSRGAAHCLFIDAEPQVLRAIEQHLQTLQCPQGETRTGQIPAALNALNKRFDIVFIDPPYALACLDECLNSLVSKHLLKENALVYIECSSQSSLPLLANCWQLHRHKTAGQVQYALLRFCAETSLSAQDPL